MNYRMQTAGECATTSSGNNFIETFYIHLYVKCSIICVDIEQIFIHLLFLLSPLEMVGYGKKIEVIFKQSLEVEVISSRPNMWAKP